MDESEHPSSPPPDVDRQAQPRPSLEPALDPVLDEHVRTLLAHNAPEAGPMPAEVADRITAALADEARLRVGRGPLTDDGGPVADMAGAPAGVTPLRRRPSRPWVALAGVAAAAVAVVAGVSALHLTTPTNPAAVVAGDPSTTSSAASSPAAQPSPHIQLSRTDYDAVTLGAKARALLDHPSTPLAPLAAESPSLGPIATPVGLASCLDALAVGPGSATVDLATFGGRPAAIIVITHDGTSTAYAVERSCSPGNVTALAGATPVP